MNKTSRTPIRIAIADDQKIFRTFLSGRIAQYSNGAIRVIHESENGAELLCRMGYDRPDLILLDLDMPVMNGLQTARYLNVLFPEIILIGITTKDIIEHQAELFRNGVRSFINRDLPAVEIIAKICRIYEEAVSEVELFPLEGRTGMHVA